MNRIQLRFGQAVGLKELIATLVVSGVLLIVGTVVFAKVKGSLQTSDLSTEANSTINEVESTAYDAFQLATVALIVLAAAVIIGILIRKVCGMVKRFTLQIEVLSGNPKFITNMGIRDLRLI